jgi:C4-dicarboxylate-specific signal transduction histidine kinase
VKNLLQSLYALTSIVPRDPGDGSAALLEKQLPRLTRRLQSTLEKLQAPEIATVELAVAASAWWSELERRVEGSGVSMKATIVDDLLVPAGLFDSFIDNTLENARAKAVREPGIAIAIDLAIEGPRLALTVCDSGSAVPERVAQRLFREPTERPTGLGIGLFHTARLAQKDGYRLELVANRDGQVCFVLARGSSTAAVGEG